MMHLAYFSNVCMMSDVCLKDHVGRKERKSFNLMTHSTHFIYGYMASDIWLRTILIVRKETRCCHISYSFRLAARVLLYAPSHRQDRTYHSLCYTSREALAGTRNSSMVPPHEGSIQRPIAPWANALTTELRLAPDHVDNERQTCCTTTRATLPACRTTSFTHSYYRRHSTYHSLVLQVVSHWLEREMINWSTKRDQFDVPLYHWSVSHFTVSVISRKEGNVYLAMHSIHFTFTVIW